MRNLSRYNVLLHFEKTVAIVSICRVKGGEQLEMGILYSFVDQFDL